MLANSVSSSGMRLVPVTNAQKTSGPRLHYKAFVGAKPARSLRRRRLRQLHDSSQPAKRLEEDAEPLRVLRGNARRTRGSCQEDADWTIMLRFARSHSYRSGPIRAFKRLNA